MPLGNQAAKNREITDHAIDSWLLLGLLQRTYFAPHATPYANNKHTVSSLWYPVLLGTHDERRRNPVLREVSRLLSGKRVDVVSGGGQVVTDLGENTLTSDIGGEDTFDVFS